MAVDVLQVVWFETSLRFLALFAVMLNHQLTQLKEQKLQNMWDLRLPWRYITFSVSCDLAVGNLVNRL